MTETEGEKKAWREVKYGRKFLNAGRGMHVFLATTETWHLATYIVSTLVAVICGFYFKISSLEWIAIVFAISLVFITEIFNTAIEIDINLTSPEYHPYARDTKDVAAAAALLSAITAVVIGLIIFLPKIILYVKI